MAAHVETQLKGKFRATRTRLCTSMLEDLCLSCIGCGTKRYRSHLERMLCITCTDGEHHVDIIDWADTTSTGSVTGTSAIWPPTKTNAPSSGRSSRAVGRERPPWASLPVGYSRVCAGADPPSQHLLRTCAFPGTAHARDIDECEQFAECRVPRCCRCHVARRSVLRFREESQNDYTDTSPRPAVHGM